MSISVLGDAKPEKYLAQNLVTLIRGTPVVKGPASKGSEIHELIHRLD